MSAAPFASCRWLRWALLAVFAALPFVWASPAKAYPFMIRHGFAKCGSCHVDPMGGETLTGFGRAMSDSKLSTRWDGGDAPRSIAELFYGVPEPDWLRLGGSFRYMNIYEFPKDGQDGDFSTFPMQLDTYGQLRFGKLRIAGSLGASRVPAGSQHAKAAQITSNNGDDEWNLISRNHWIGYDITDSILIRAGRINLPFGIRMPEHVMWVRDSTRTDRESDQQHGLALSYSKGRWRGEIMAIAGNYQIKPDEVRERGYSLNGEYLFSTSLGLGVSSLVTRSESDRILLTNDPYTRQAHGLTARWTPFYELVLLGEADVLLASNTGTGYAGVLQADVEPVQGLHFMGTLEAQDRGKPDGLEAVKGAGDPQFGGWLSVNWFVFTHMDFRVDLVARQESPLTLQGQYHFYF